jgi:hypothetical protein
MRAVRGMTASLTVVGVGQDRRGADLSASRLGRGYGQRQRDMPRLAGHRRGTAAGAGHGTRDTGIITFCLRGNASNLITQ